MSELATTSTDYLSINNASHTLYLAQDLAKFIKDNRLSSKIQGKDFVSVEGWEYAGIRLGIIPIVEDIKNLSTGEEIKYGCWVALKNIQTDVVVGRGYAICSNKEGSKRSFAEYAIASMAQTRAIGKAYRNILAWIIRAAGYEPTPAEEMSDVHVEEDKPKAATKPTKAKAEPETVAPQLATVKQKTEMLLLLNNKHILPDEKAKMIDNINTLDTDRMEKALAKVKATIRERESAEPQTV